MYAGLCDLLEGQVLRKDTHYAAKEGCEGSHLAAVLVLLDHGHFSSRIEELHRDWVAGQVQFVEYSWVHVVHLQEMLLTKPRIGQKGSLEDGVVVLETHALGVPRMEHVRGHMLEVWEGLVSGSRAIGVVIAVKRQILERHMDLTSARC